MSDLTVSDLWWCFVIGLVVGVMFTFIFIAWSYERQPDVAAQEALRQRKKRLYELVAEFVAMGYGTDRATKIAEGVLQREADKAIKEWDRVREEYDRL